MADRKTPEQDEAVPAVPTFAVEATATGPDGAPDENGTYLRGIEWEYAQYRATQNILVNGVLAFTKGDPVPASHPHREAWAGTGAVEATGAKAPAGARS